VARTADRTITLVLDPDDDIDTLRRLRRLHARPLGQVVCEPAPGGGSAALAYGLLAALGKTLDLEAPRDPLGRLVDVHLRAERVRHLVVLRAHTLTYLALRRVADHAQAAGARLWLVVHKERPPAAIAQLLESVPHETAPLAVLLALTPELVNEDDGGDVPPGAGLEFPYLSAIHDLFEPLPRRRVRATLTRGFPRGERAVVYDAWEQAHDWTRRWLDDRAEWIDQDAADATLALARRGDTASEIYVRIRAALDAFEQAGVHTNVRAVDRIFEHAYGETRPCELNATVAHAAALADQTPDSQLAALIVIAALTRSPYYLRHANLRGLAPDGAILVGPYGRRTRRPTRTPPLPRHLAARTRTPRQRPRDPALRRQQSRTHEPASHPPPTRTTRRPRNALGGPTRHDDRRGAERRRSKPAPPPLRLARLARTQARRRTPLTPHASLESSATRPARAVPLDLRPTVGAITVFSADLIIEIPHLARA
jgi:hypothetical protein